MPKAITKTLLWTAAAAEIACAFAAVPLLMPGLYNTSQYRVDPAGAAPWWYYAALVVPAIVLAAGARLIARRGAQAPGALAAAWSPLILNVVDVVRAALGDKPLFAGPLILAVSAGWAVMLSLALAARGDGGGRAPTAAAPIEARWRHLAALAAVVLSALAAVSMYALQEGFLAKLVFGWTDAALYYARVKNTANGIGFLQETLARATFYDHFSPGLTLLVPFYWLFPAFKLIMWAQAICLAAVAPAVYVYARGRAIRPLGALMLAAAVLMHPSISQMAVSFSYGFHPVTLALPAVVLSIHFWEKRRWLPFAICAVVAASMEETLFPLYAGVGLVEAMAPRGRRRAGAGLFAAAAALFVIVVKLVLPAAAGDAQYFQFAKYAHLGSSLTEIALSPFTRPGVFWGLIFSERSATFVGLILGSMAFLPLLAPRQLLYPALVLVFVLLLDNANVKSISFWYQALVVVDMVPRGRGGHRAARLVARPRRPRSHACSNGRYGGRGACRVVLLRDDAMVAHDRALPDGKIRGVRQRD